MLPPSQGTVASSPFIVAGVFSELTCFSSSSSVGLLEQGTFTAGRVLAIPLSLVATPKTLTTVDVVGCLIASFLFVTFAGAA